MSPEEELGTNLHKAIMADGLTSEEAVFVADIAIAVSALVKLNTCELESRGLLRPNKFMPVLRGVLAIIASYPGIFAKEGEGGDVGT